MNTKDIKATEKEISKLIGAKRLRDAIDKMRAIAIKHRMYGVLEKINAVDATYQLMLHYLSNGFADPQREDMYRQITVDLYALLDQIVLNLEKVDNPSLYYGTLRLFETAPKEGRIASLLQRCAAAADKLSIFSMITDNGINGKEGVSQREAENMQSDLFVCLWVTPRLTKADADAVKEALNGDVFSPEFKSHIISALTLANLQTFDPRKLDLMLTAYGQNDGLRAQATALVGILLSLWKNAERQLPKDVEAHLQSIKDSEHWASDLRIATIELIRARDTERINRKMADEVIPEMMNLRPEILNKINRGEINPNDMASLEANPEWQELLDKNGITDKLKELSEIQMEGGDVMMSTFAHLKSFPFFNDIANWFLPYSQSHSSIALQVKSMGVTADMIDNAMFLCDSDKYSFMMAVSHVPEAQRDMMTSQFQAQSDSIYEAMSETANAPQPAAMRKAVNQYVQNIYRFFKLYRRKDEFEDPFVKGINLVSVPTLSEDFNDVEMLKVIAEFYLKLGYWQDALDVMLHLEQLEMPDAQMRQKMGYCYERLGVMHKAAELYKEAELLDSDSNWTIRRLLSVSRALGDKKQALKYSRQLAQRQPDDLSVTLMLGYALLDMEEYEEAVKQFYKVEFLDEKSRKSWRPLAWTLFLIGNFDDSKKYFDKILLDKPTATDYLNMGHLSLAMGRMQEAINNYKLTLQEGFTVEQFLEALNADSKAMSRAGIPSEIVPLVADAVLYSLYA